MFTPAVYPGRVSRGFLMSMAVLPVMVLMSAGSIIFHSPRPTLRWLRSRKVVAAAQAKQNPGQFFTPGRFDYTVTLTPRATRGQLEDLARSWPKRPGQSRLKILSEKTKFTALPDRKENERRLAAFGALRDELPEASISMQSTTRIGLITGDPWDILGRIDSLVLASLEWMSGVSVASANPQPREVKMPDGSVNSKADLVPLRHRVDQVLRAQPAVTSWEVELGTPGAMPTRIVVCGERIGNEPSVQVLNSMDVTLVVSVGKASTYAGKGDDNRSAVQDALRTFSWATEVEGRFAEVNVSGAKGQIIEFGGQIVDVASRYPAQRWLFFDGRIRIRARGAQIASCIEQAKFLATNPNLDHNGISVSVPYRRLIAIDSVDPARAQSIARSIRSLNWAGELDVILEYPGDHGTVTARFTTTATGRASDPNFEGAQLGGPASELIAAWDATAG